MAEKKVVEVSNKKTDSKKNEKQKKITKEKKETNNIPMKRKVGDTISELKKVEWPNFETTFKKTCTVLAFCAISLVFLLLIDLLLKYFVRLLSL